MKNLIKMIGKTVSFNGDSITFLVTITDVRKVYGRVDYEIKPVAGSGSKWVSSDRIKGIGK